VRTAILLAAALLVPAAATADTTWVAIGSPANQNAVPFWGQSYDAFRCQWLYYQSEINHAGDIVAIGLYSPATAPVEYYHVTVSCCHTPLSELTQDFNANYGGNAPSKLLDAETLLVGTGVSQTWYYFPGTYTYNNTENLIVEITWRGDAGVSVPFYRNGLGHINRRVFAYSDTASSGFRDTVNGSYIRLGFLPTAVEETENSELRTEKGGATVVRNVLVVGLGTRSGLSDNPVMSRAALRDASGRTVMALKPGANDVSRLAPGVYFVRGQSAVRRIVVTR
jgi:hypothetical protein